MSMTNRNRMSTRCWPRVVSLVVKRAASAITLIAALAVAMPAQAQVTWNGSASNLWSNTANWSSWPPASNANLIWNSSSLNLTSTNNLSSPLTVGRLLFDTSGVVLSGSAITLSQGGSTPVLSGTGGGYVGMNITLTGTAPRFGNDTTGDHVIAGVISASGANAGTGVNGGYVGTVTFLGANTFGGDFFAGGNGGTAIINTLGNSGVSQATGQGNTIQLGGVGSTASGALVYTGAAATTNKSLRIGGTTASNGFAGSFINDGSGAVTWNGSQTVPSGITAARTFTLGGFNTAANEWTTALSNNGSGGVAFTKSGVGNWTLSGANTFTGAVTVNAGRLVLDYKTNNNAVLPSGSNSVTLGGGTLELQGNASAATSQTFGALTSTNNTGISTVMLRANGGQTISGSFGAVTNANAALLFDLGTNATAWVGTGVSPTGSSIPRYLLRDSTGRVDYAQNNNSAATALTALNAPTGALVANPASNGNYSLTTSSTITGNTNLAGTLRIDPAASGTLTLNQGTATGNTQFRSMMLVGSNNFTITQAAGQTGALGNGTTAATALLLYSFSTGTLTLDARVGGNSTGGTGAVEFFGTGLIDWTRPANTTGAVTIGGVTLRQSASNGQLLTNTATGNGSGNIVLTGGGVLEISGGASVTRNVGTAAGGIQWLGSGGGFSAFGGTGVVNLGGALAAINWTDTGFVGNERALVLGSAASDSLVDFQNPLSFGARQRLVEVRNGSAEVDARFSGVLSGGLAGGLLKRGGGSLEITAAATYGGETWIEAGQLRITGAGGINASRLVWLNNAGSELKYNASTPLTAPLQVSAGTLSGTGAISAAGGVTIGTNATLSPGNSPGTQAFTTGLTMAAGGSYLWEINDWNGTQGVDPGWDLLAVSGSPLNITATSGSPFTINLTSLTGSTAGAVANFNGDVNKTFTIATAGSITGFDASAFTLNTTQFSSFNTYSGTWSITSTGNALQLNYMAPVTTTTGTYSLSASAGAATIIAGGSSTITATITNTGAGTADALNYGSLAVGQGVSISPSTGSNLAQAASGTGTGVFTTSTPGVYSFDPTATVTNATLGGAAVLSGSTATSVTVLDHATSSLSGLAVLTSSTISLGTWDYESQSWTAGDGTSLFSIFNLNPNVLDPSFVALLNLTGTSASGDSGFTLDADLNPASFAMIAGGTSASYSVSYDPTGMNTQGIFSRTFTFQMADQNLPGGQATNTLTLTAAVIVVPEPGAIALAGIGIAAAAYAYRRRRCLQARSAS